jgi:HK97 family phage prohead protease
LPLELKTAGEAGSFEGYGAIFGNIDRDGDIVARGAFAASLKARLPALLWQHNAKEPIGRFDMVREDEKGLYVRGRLSMEGRGREAYELLKMGALDGLSIGFVTREASRDARTGARTIHRAELMEISLVTFPANEMARVTSVKARGGQLAPPEDRAAFLSLLMDNGIAPQRARAIADGGVRSVERREIAALMAELKERSSIFEAKNWFWRERRLWPHREEVVSIPQPDQYRGYVKVIPPNKIAEFDCFVDYYEFNAKSPIRRTEHLYRKSGGEKLRETVTFGRKDLFDALDVLTSGLNIPPDSKGYVRFRCTAPKGGRFRFEAN